MADKPEHQCIHPSSPEWEKMLKRLAEGDERMTRMEDALQRNTDLTQKTANGTADMVAAFEAARGAFKVLEFVGKVAKPLLVFGAFCAAVYGYWLQLKAGGGIK